MSKKCKGMLEHIEGFNQIPPRYWRKFFNFLGVTEEERVATFKAVLRGELFLKLEEREITLFDRHGRCIPSPSVTHTVTDPNREFHLIQPEKFDYSAILARLQQFFSEGTIFCSAEVFEEGSRALLVKLENDPELRNILNGVHLPICLPQLKIDDLGKSIEEFFLPAVSSSYQEHFPDRKFDNYRKGQLTDDIGIPGSTRHRQLIEQMAAGPVIGIYFPNPLQGYSPLAAREQLTLLPDTFLLSGLDTLVTMVAYPEVLARDWHTPGLDLIAFSWQSPVCSLYFEADDDSLDFRDRGNLGLPGDYFSSGLFFIG